MDRLETIEQDEQTYRPTRVLFYWPLGAALIISFILAIVSIPWLALTARARIEIYEEEEKMELASGEGNA